MTRKAALAALALLGLAAAAALAEEDAKAPEPQAAAMPAANGVPTWYAQALARGAGGLNVTHFWSKGPWLRAETVVAGHKVVNIVKGPWYYTYDGLTKKGLAIRRDPKAEAADSPQRRPFGREYEILTRQGAEQVSTQEALGRQVGVYRVTDMRGQREVWVTLDEQKLPLRLEIYDRKAQSRRFTDYVNWQSAMAIPDGFFEPEPDVQIERLELEQYIKRTLAEGPVGAIPVLYADLLHARHEE